MKKLLVLITLVISFYANAEHDAVYCGTIEKDPSGEAFVLLNVGYLTNTDSDIWKGEYEVVSGKAKIYNVNNAEKVMWFLENSRKGTVFCAKGRWGGAFYSHTLESDSIYKFDYASRFTEEELDDANVY